MLVYMVTKMKAMKKMRVGSSLKWQTIFYAKRDNHGKNIPLSTFIQKLKRTL